MPSHTHASVESRRCCDSLFESLKRIIPEVSRKETQETCAFYVPGRNRFAHVYHRSQDSSVRVYFRGDLSLVISDPTGSVDVFRRDKVEKGWDKEFPYYASFSSPDAVDPFGKLLMAVSFPLSEKKRRSVVDESLEVLDQKEIVFMEGEQIELSRRAYRRATGARNACIAYHGSKCSICEFNFEYVYGEIGRGYIHVHHIKEISAFEGEHCVDPIRDLVPVCPNCHAMLHHRSRPSCVDLKSKIRNDPKTSGLDY